MTIQSREFVEKRYDDTIRYYWAMASRNKLAYKWSRYLTIVLGAVVTLVASLSSAKLPDGLGVAIAIATPLTAAILTVIGGFSQSFQWGASWREMVLTAERLEAERDRIAVTPDAELVLQRELDFLNRLVQRESSGFFDRVMGSSMTANGEPPAHTPGAAPLQTPAPKATRTLPSEPALSPAPADAEQESKAVSN